ncbi:MAG TPA: ComEC/Rec2 family competence protein, partial [Chloroflexi bacterium]|nr:ComEC/Rec2 family competence protein [Chloroflexota bacterium]
LGLVVEFPDRRDQIQNLRVKVESLNLDGEEQPYKVNGFLLAKVPVEGVISYGDRVRLRGYLDLPPEEGDFNYRAYLARKNIYAYLPNAELEVLETGQGNIALQAIYDLKKNALERIYVLWPDPEASLLAGILLGVESGISDQVQKAFRDTGTTHIIAISGFNITIVAGLFSRLFSRLLDKRQAGLAAVLGISIYTLLVGADPAVVRAAVMGGLSIFAGQIGRRQHGLNAAALASLIMILFNPRLPWDISFQLSLSATLGLILYADPLADWFLGLISGFLPLEAAQKLTRPVSEYFLFTLAAQLTTLPVMIYHFHSFSLSTFLANPAILPVQPPIMIVGGLGLILGLIWLPLGRVTAPLVYPFVLYTIRVVEWFSRLPIRPGAVGEISPGWIFGFYGLLGVFTFGRELLILLRNVLRPAAVGSALAILTVILWRGFFSAPDGLVHLTLLDVGTGSAILLESPTGQRVLINGGPSTKQLSDHLGRRLPPFQRELDLLLIASPALNDLDALGGILPRFNPQQVIWLGADDLCWEAENLRSLMQENQIPVVYGKAGQTLLLSDGLRVKILAVNARGGTLLIQYGDFQALFPFGIRAEDRQDWGQGRELGEINVYYLADNGYQSSNPSVWIENLRPELLLLSVGVTDNRGLPDRGLMDRLGGYSLLRTDENGSISLLTDGKKLWIRVDRLEGL